MLFDDEDEERMWVACAARILVLLERTPPIQLRSGIRDVEIKRDLEFWDVSFGYDAVHDPTNEDYVLEGFSVAIKAGMKVGFVGPSEGARARCSCSGSWTHRRVRCGLMDETYGSMRPTSCTPL